MQDFCYDSLVIGAGPAGLSAALYLARMDRQVLVLDEGHGRSTWHQVNRNYLGFPGGVQAQRLRELGREQLAEYPHVTFKEHQINKLIRQPDGTFIACSQAGEWRGRTVIICAGVIDQYPHFNGWKDFVGRSLFWCLVCDGYESKGKRVVIIGNRNSAVGEALQLSRFTDKITLLTNSNDCWIDEAHQKRLEKFNFPLIHDKIISAIGQDGQLEALITRDGRRIELDLLFNHRSHVPQSKLASDLGLELDEEGYIITDTDQKTNVEGVYAAGDVTLINSHQIVSAAHEGAQAALAANYYLYPPELRGE